MKYLAKVGVPPFEGGSKVPNRRTDSKRKARPAGGSDALGKPRYFSADRLSWSNHRASGLPALLQVSR
jgi:hypothetical protein